MRKGILFQGSKRKLRTGNCRSKKISSDSRAQRRTLWLDWKLFWPDTKTKSSLFIGDMSNYYTLLKNIWLFLSELSTLNYSNCTHWMNYSTSNYEGNGVIWRIKRMVLSLIAYFLLQFSWREFSASPHGFDGQEYDPLESSWKRRGLVDGNCENGRRRWYQLRLSWSTSEIRNHLSLYE